MSKKQFIMFIIIYGVLTLLIHQMIRFIVHKYLSLCIKIMHPKRSLDTLSEKEQTTVETIELVLQLIIGITIDALLLIPASTIVKSIW